MAAVAYLAAHPELPRPTLRVGFTPDEEIGEGATLFDIERFGARCAYTLDGSQPGELQDETFSARRGRRHVARRRRPPRLGDRQARQRRAARRPRARRAARRPAHARDHVGPRRVHPPVLAARLGRPRPSIRAIVRDFDDELLDRHVALLRTHCRARSWPPSRGRASRRRGAAAVPEHAPLHRAGPRGGRGRRARDPRRGDRGRAHADPRRHRRLGASARRGLPTPNLFTGGHEYHSVREWASVQDMASAAAVVVRLAEAWAP